MALNTIKRINGIPLEDSLIRYEVLTKDNTETYTPSGDYNPSTKKYVDDKFDNLTINVKDFGAVGDGIIDDSTAFQNALNHCATEQKSLFIPSGKYHITTPLTGFNYMSIYGEGRTSELLLDLNEGEYCFDAYSANENEGWVYSFIMEKLTFSRYNTSSKKIGTVRVSNSLRGLTLRDIYVNNIFYPWYFGPNIWGNIVIDNVHAYAVDSDNPVDVYTEDCLPALYSYGNSIRIINSDIIGGFAKGLEINQGNSITIENSNIGGSELTYYMKRPIILKNVTCVDISNLYIECPDPSECEGDTNGDAPMITVQNSTKININDINLGQGSIYFDNSSGKITNINYGQYAGGLKLQNNSKVIADNSAIGHWDKNLDTTNCSGNVILLEDNSINIEASENSILSENENLPFVDTGYDSESDNTDFETGTRSIKFHVTSTMEYGYILAVPLNNNKVGDKYTIHARVKRDSNISSLKIVNKGTEALANHKYVYTENYSANDEWYDVSYVVETKQANASVLLQAASGTEGYFWLDRITVYKGFTNNFKNELNDKIIASKKYVEDKLSDYAPINSPDFTGDLSLGRKADTSIGLNSIATGYNVIASGDVSHAEGNETNATQYASHAEGYKTTASGQASHAEGVECIASADGTHAEGTGTKASSSYQHVQGKHNIEDTENKYLHIVGNGSSDTARSNAHTLDWSGNAWFAGKLTQEGTPTEDKDLSTKKYVDDKVAGIVDSAPETLDTLKELSTALGDDANFAATVSTQIGNKVDKVDGKGLSTNDLTTNLKNNYDAAYTHSTSAHAPVNAQKNSDITKAEIEAKLTGNITSHTHSQYLTEHQSLNGYAKTADLATVATSGSYNDLSNKPTIPTIPSSLPANGGNADTVNNFHLWKGTQAQYDAITNKDSNTIYMITG